MVHHRLLPPPDEPAAEARAAGLSVDRVVFVEGPMWNVHQLDQVLAERSAQVLDLLRQVEAEPSLLGASSHLLTIARCNG
jgi:hypothetical protein